jgi:hypothetical protein
MMRERVKAKQLETATGSQRTQETTPGAETTSGQVVTVAVAAAAMSTAAAPS